MINEHAERFALTPGEDLTLDRDGGQTDRRTDGQTDDEFAGYELQPLPPPFIDAFAKLKLDLPQHPFNFHNGDPGDKYRWLAENAAAAIDAGFALNGAHVIPSEVIIEFVDGAWANKNLAQPWQYLEALVSHINSTDGARLREIIQQACTAFEDAPFVIVRGSDQNSQYGTGAGAPSEFCKNTPEFVTAQVLKVIIGSLLSRWT